MAMAWIESHQTLARHPKARRAAALLGISLPQLIGHLHLLWWWAHDYAPDGDLSSFAAGELAEAALWEGDAAAFVAALLDCGPGGRPGFLERREDQLLLHDWQAHTGRLIARRRADAARKRTGRPPAAAPDQASGQLPAEPPRDVPRNLMENQSNSSGRPAEASADVPRTSSGLELENGQFPADVQRNLMENQSNSSGRPAELDRKPINFQRTSRGGVRGHRARARAEELTPASPTGESQGYESAGETPAESHHPDSARIEPTPGGVGSARASPSVRRRPEEIATWEPELFARLWAYYGKLGGVEQAAREWDRLKPDRALMRAMRLAIDQQRLAFGWGEPGGQAQPHLSTWLHQRRWHWEPVPNKIDFAR
jgi:hypothetical protein